MTAPIDIANRALAQIRAGRTIAAFNENSEEANACGRFYETARDAALAAYPWSFARRYAVLALLPDAPLSGERFAYRMPDDCLQAIAVHTHGQVPRRHGRSLRMHPHQDYALASDSDGQVILTDVEQAVLEYTARVANPDAWSVPFQQVVAFLLASYIAVPITGESSMATANLNYYKDALEGAKLHSISQHHEQPERVYSGAEARL